MPLFVSYSHTDRDFANKLAMQLVKHKANVWIDQWELRVGDSLFL
ncbi:MAG: toll/interleukin-1 receptor domain-containing protein [Bryobacteraceae bacterium]|nr:toll/interleukin-1 receptor domain-containing protein [Bryobacteraceae bacterium]